jgi:hypothetical protein
MIESIYLDLTIKITIILIKSAFSNFRGRTKTLPSARPRLFRYGKKWHNIWKQHDRGGGAIFGDRGSGIGGEGLAWQHDRGASPQPPPSSRCHLPEINAAPCRQPRRRRLPSYPRSAAAWGYGGRSSDGAEVLHAFRDGGHDFVEVVAASCTQGVSPRSRRA